MFWFFLGLMIGAVFGVMAMCLCIAAGNADRAEERARERAEGTGEFGGRFPARGPGGASEPGPGQESPRFP